MDRHSDSKSDNKVIKLSFMSSELSVGGFQTTNAILFPSELRLDADHVFVRRPRRR